MYRRIFVVDRFKAIEISDIIPILREGLVLVFGQSQVPGIADKFNGDIEGLVDREYNFDQSLVKHLNRLAERYRVAIRITQRLPVVSPILECYVRGKGVSGYGSALLLNSGFPFDEERLIGKIREAIGNAKKELEWESISQQKRLG